ncbi:MAG: hypothetical protein ACFCUI_08635 [Bernardetiaceae bacterium]
MKAKCFVFCWLWMIGCGLVAAQDIGINVHYAYTDALYWQSIVRAHNTTREQLPDLRHAYGFGVDMGFALSYRLRLLPEINYQRLGSSNALTELSQQYLGAFVHLQLYPFGFGTQLHCPTFGQVPYGRSPQSGFFLRFSVGGQTLWARTRRDGQQTTSPRTQTASIGLGMGYDWMPSERISLTPILHLRYHPDLRISDYDKAITGTEVLNLRNSDEVLMFGCVLRLAYIL